MKFVLISFDAIDTKDFLMLLLDLPLEHVESVYRDETSNTFHGSFVLFILCLNN